MLRLASLLLTLGPADAVSPPQPAAASRPPWIKRHAPERHLVEFGPYFGAFLPSRNHELYEPDATLPDQGYRDFKTAMGDFGLRVGYFPLRFFGLELEGGAMPGRTVDDTSASVFTFRGHVVGQLGLWRITPFLLAGVSSIGVRSARTAVGDDTDVGAHFGGGAKLYITRFLAARLDLRNVITAKRGLENGLASNGEILLGLSITVGRKKPKPPPAPPPTPTDSDDDGVLDPDDACPHEPAQTDDGCPVPDTDGDGVLDDADECPDEAANTEHGCPIPDTDGDGVLDPNDACVDVAAPTPDGCPIPDADGDGILDPSDTCKDEAETLNGIKDEDGCPDALPEELTALMGVLSGVGFKADALRPGPHKRLDAIAEVLAKHPGVRVQITVHTDSKDVEKALERSLTQADAVRGYLADKGVDPGRIDTRGAGSNEPLLDDAGKPRKKNRRVEMAPAPPASP